jgi:hypothetical protein
MHYTVSIFCLLLLAGPLTPDCHCQSERGQPAPYSVRWTPRIPLASLAHAAEFLRRPVEPGIMMARGNDDGSGQELVGVRTGAEYVKALKAGFQPHLGIDLTGSGRFTVAHCVHQLRHAKPSRRSHVANLRLDRLRLGELPAELTPIVSGEQQQAAQIKKHGWADRTARITEAQALKLVIDGDDGKATFWTAGWGDFNGDGLEDVLLGAYYDFSPGSLSYGTTVIVTRRAPGGHLELVNREVVRLE